MEGFTSVIQMIMARLFDAAGRELHHLLHYNIKELEQKLKKLEGNRKRIQSEIDVAEGKGETIHLDVQNWIKEVDKILAEVEELLKDEDKVNKRCLKGWCINLESRYQFSREAEQKINEIIRLQDDGKFKTVSHLASPSGLESFSTAFSSTIESRKLIMKKVMETMSDVNVSIIGICGMAGVGKTTLMKEISKQAKEDKLYDVVMVVVSQHPSIVNIQGEIADMLGVKLSDNSELARADFLCKRFKAKKHILVVLDDVWGRIALDEIGIPFGKDHGGCKIIVISRSKTVCNQMECQKIFTVETLSVPESWILFKEHAGGNVEKSDINPSAKEVCAKCGGLPIVISTIARELKDRKLHVWRDAARELKKSSLKNNKVLQERLELTYNHLEKEEAKSLFLLCSLFPEDFAIPIEDLMRYGMGLGLFDVETMNAARDRAHTLVSDLTYSFLLINDDDKETVKMNVVIRDFALIIAPKHNHIFMVEASAGIKEWPARNTHENLSYISLMSNDIQEVPNGLKFPNLQALLLQKNSKLVVPDNFFQEMEDLKILDLSKTKLSPLPSSLSLLVNLRTLYLNHCELGDLSIIGKLGNLEILSLSDSNVEEIPISFRYLNHLKFLDLNRCRQLKKISSGVLQCLRKLEELYMIESFRDWDIGRKDDLSANAHLTVLPNLSICIPNPETLPNDTMFEKLSTFILETGIRDCIQDKRGYSRNMMLSCMNISSVSKWIKNMLQKTEDLLLIDISDLENILHDLVKEELNDLKSLTIRTCKINYLLNIPNLTVLNSEKVMIDQNPKLVDTCHGQPRSSDVEIENEENMLILPLKELKLMDLPMMTNIFVGNHQLLSLYNLKVMYVHNCPNLVQLISLAPLQTLICLEKVDINGCNNLEEIFGTNRKEDVKERKVLWSKNHSVTSPSLGNLTYLSIRGCSKLKTLFTPCIVKSLVQLRTLRLHTCLIIQEIVTKEEGVEAASTKKIVFPSLYNLELEYLNELTCFSSGSCIVEFPSLETLTISDCPKMEKFGNGGQVTPKLKSVFLNKRFQWMGNLNATVESFYKRKVQVQMMKERDDILNERRQTKSPKTDTSVVQENEEMKTTKEQDVEQPGGSLIKSCFHKRKRTLTSKNSNGAE